MSSNSGGIKKKYLNFRSRQRANMSFFIVVMFFAVFGIIVFTEIFLIDERGRGAGVLVRHGSLAYQQKHLDRNDYEDNFQENDDYISIRVGAAMLSDDTVGALLIGRPPVALPVIDSSPLSSKIVNEHQLPPYPDHLTASPGVWQNVIGTKYKFFVFSAFLDNRKGQRNIRIVGATKTRGPERVYCRMWYRLSDTNTTRHIAKTVPAKIKVIRENWNLKYSACFILCPLNINQTIPNAVSVVAKLREPPTNLLAVINNNYNESYRQQLPPMTASNMKFAICIKPLHFDYNRELQILEFIELNRLLGVEHFFLYNHTIGQHVNCILRDYMERGIVTMLPWQLDMVSQKEIRTEGLFAALNDCLYRAMYRYTHVVIIDFDEYIMPNYNDTLPQLIENLNQRMNARSTGSYSFQNAFFYLQWKDDESIYDLNDPIAFNLITLKKTRRKTKLHPHKQRSKYICRPELVVEAGNHFIWEFIPGHGTLNVPAQSAILHHYRICEFGGNDCIKTASTIDLTAYRYKDELIRMVKERYSELRSKCMLDALPTPSAKIFNQFISNILPPADQNLR